MPAANNFAGYVMTVTQNPPQQFRASLAARMQCHVPDTVENLYRANEIFATGSGDPGWQGVCLRYQPMTDLKLLNDTAQGSMEQKCLRPKQFEQISVQGSDCRNRLGAWINRDRRSNAPQKAQGIPIDNSGDACE